MGFALRVAACGRLGVGPRARDSQPHASYCNLGVVLFGGRASILFAFAISAQPLDIRSRPAPAFTAVPRAHARSCQRLPPAQLRDMACVGLLFGDGNRDSCLADSEACGVCEICGFFFEDEARVELNDGLPDRRVKQHPKQPRNIRIVPVKVKNEVAKTKRQRNIMKQNEMRRIFNGEKLCRLFVSPNVDILDLMENRKTKKVMIRANHLRAIKLLSHQRDGSYWWRSAVMFARMEAGLSGFSVPRKGSVLWLQARKHLHSMMHPEQKWLRDDCPADSQEVEEVD